MKKRIVRKKFLKNDLKNGEASRNFKNIAFQKSFILTILAIAIFFPIYNTSLAEGACDKATSSLCVELTEPIGDTEMIEGSSGVDLIRNYIKGIYAWAAGLVGIVAVLNMVIAGIEIITSADSERSANAKTRIMQSLAAIAVLFLSGLILYTINPNFFTKT